jgi:hypothetical protein
VAESNTCDVALTAVTGWPRNVAPSTWVMSVERVSQYRNAAMMSAFAGTPLMGIVPVRNPLAFLTGLRSTPPTA